MPEPIRPPQIHGDKGQAHQNRRDGEQFAEDNQVVQVLVLVNVNRDYEHDRGGGDADEKGEIGDVDAPGYLIGHVGHDEAVDKLLGIGVQTQQTNGKQRPRPEVIAPVAFE